MAKLLGNSRTWKWALCGCQHCRDHDKDYFRMLKRTARNRENRLWRSEID